VASEVPNVAEEVAALLHCPVFRTRTCLDVATVEICGALKNVIAMGAGMVIITTKYRYLSFI